MSYSTKKLSMIVLFFIMLYPCSAQDEKLQIALLDFSTTGGLSRQETITLSNRLRSMLVQTQAVIVIERGKMEEILTEQGFQQTGCTTTECAVEAGKLLNVQKMVSGSIGKIGQTYTIDLALIDVETAQIEKSFVQDYKGEIDGLLTMMQETANQIALKELAQKGKKPTDASMQKGGFPWLWVGGGAIAGGVALFLISQGDTGGGDSGEDQGFPKPPSRP